MTAHEARPGWAAWLAAGALQGAARALALAGLALAGSEVEAALAPEFLLTWGALFGVLTLPLALLEAPLLRLLAGRGGGRRLRGAAGAGLAALGWGALLAASLLQVRCLGWGAAPAMAAAAALSAGLWTPAGARTRGAWLAGGLAALLAGGVVAAALLADPEGTYNQRYAENRLSPADLAAPPPLGELDPAQASDLQVARALAHTWMRTHPVDELRWSWEEAVALEGLLHYGRVAGDPAPAAYARAWAAAHAEEALTTPLWADAAAPAGTLLLLEERSETEERVVGRVREDLRGGARRTAEGVYSHVGDLLGGVLPPQAWVDSLFMHGVTLNRTYRQTGAEWAREEAVRQLRGMSAGLQSEGGFFRHAYVDLGSWRPTLPVEETFWARGNAWVLFFLVDHQRARLARGLEPDPELTPVMERLARAFLAAQGPASALWSSDLTGGDRTARPPEPSASALVVAALGRAQAAGLLTELPLAEALARARPALRGCLRWERGHPVLAGTSTGTSPGFRAYYRAVPRDDNVGHGVGAWLLALPGE